MAKFSNQQFLLQIDTKKTRRSGQGAWRGVDEISGMRDGWHTTPVKLLSQLGLSFSPPCSTNSSMGLSRYKRLRYRLTFWTVCTAHTGQFKAVDPQYEQKIRGTQAWFYQSSGTTGVDDAGSTVATQRSTSMQYQVAFLDFV